MEYVYALSFVSVVFLLAGVSLLVFDVSKKIDDFEKYIDEGIS